MFSGQDDRPVAILVTETDAVVRMTTVDLLADAGFRTIEALHAREALALLSAHASVLLLITGRSLPGEIDGIGLARIAHRHRPALGIIITTGGFALAAEDLPPGARLLLKPYSFETLMRTVRHFVPEEVEAAQNAPVVPQGLPSGHLPLGSAGEIAAPVSEPDTT